MTQESKIEKLRRFVARKPEDPFPRYGLAMELKKQNRLSEAIETFQDLVDRFPGYTAAYYHFGSTLLKADREREAESILEKGVEVAERNGEGHAKDEIQALLADLTSD